MASIVLHRRTRRSRLLTGAVPLLLIASLSAAPAAAAPPTTEALQPERASTMALRADLDDVDAALEARFDAASARVSDDEAGWRHFADGGGVGWDRFSNHNIAGIYYDVCDDSTVDVHDIALADNYDTERFFFGYQTCPGITARPDDMVMSWTIDVEMDGYGDYAVLIGRNTSGFLIRVVDVRSSDPNAWSVVYEEAAQQEHLPATRNSMAYGSIPWWTIDAPYDYAFTSTAMHRTDDVVDHLPEPHEGVLFFPYTCDYFEFSSAQVTTHRGEAGTVADTLRRLGFRVRGVGDASLLVDPVSDAQLPQLRQLGPVVDVYRPTAWSTLSTDDPEPSGWALDQIRASAGWAITPSAQVPIAVIDSGIDAGRADLRGRVAAGWDAVTGRPLATGANSARGDGHGTSVAGVAAATRDNGQEVAGLNHGATLVPYRVSDPAGCVLPAYVAAAIDRLAASGQARVVNISVGGTEPDPAVTDAIRRAKQAGLIVVAASGNDGTSHPNHPAALPETIAVGASAPGGQVASYSSYGPHIDLVAPGGRDDGTRAGDIAVLGDLDTIPYAAGTSYAAPYVAGAISLLLGSRPQLTFEQVRDTLTATAADVGPAGPDDRSGHGILDLEAALRRAGLATPAPTPSEPPADDGTAPGFDGDPATTERLDHHDVFRAAVLVSQDRFDGTDRRPAHAVLARSDRFADALAGAALTAEGPLLYSFPDRIPQPTVDELARLFPAGGRVYLLGGQAALDGHVVDQLRQMGLSPTRLHGPSRVETAISVADKVIELYGPPADLLLARADGPAGDPTAAWADAITSGAYAADTRTPLLLTPTAELHPAVDRWLEQRPAPRRVLVGGEAALSGSVWGAVDGKKIRVAGRDRAETAVKVADHLWQHPLAGHRRAVVFNAWHASGWAFGLATAGLSADADAPLFATNADGAPAVTIERLANCGTTAVDVHVAGSEALVSARVVSQLDQADGRAC